MKLPEAVFHYTVGPKLPLIAGSRQLLPTGYGLALSSREKPVLWWSENPQWEPTATKAMSRDGETFFRPSVQEMQTTVGMYRFRLDCRNPDGLNKVGIKLVPWARMQLIAHIDPQEAVVMVSSGVKLGATPAHWWGCLDPVPVSLEKSGMLRLEHRPGNRWEPVEGGLAAAVAAYERMVEERGQRIQQSTATLQPRARGI